MYLGVASLGLVFLGQHILFNSPTVTGGFNGRDVPPFELFGFTFDDVAGSRHQWFGMQFTRTGKLWFVALVALFAHLVVRAQPAAQPCRPCECGPSATARSPRR